METPNRVALRQDFFSVLDSEEIAFPHPYKVALNVAQTKASLGHNFIPCLVPNGSYWLAWLVRRPVGREFLNFMGLYVSLETSRRYASSFLQNLGGNAFHVVSAVLACAVKFAVLARVWTLRKKARIQTVPSATSSEITTLLCMSDSDADQQSDADCDCVDMLSFVSKLS